MNYELKKINVKIIIAVIAVAILVNGWFFMSSQKHNNGYILSNYDSYKASIALIKENNDQLTQEITELSPLYNTLVDIVQYPYTYRLYISEMKSRVQNAEALSQGANYALMNAEKTLSDFKNVKDIYPKAGLYLATSTSFSHFLTDIVLLSCLAFFCIRLVFYEQEKALYKLVLTTPSRLSLVISKIFTVILLSWLTTIVLFAENYVFSVALYGADVLSLPIQSIAQFQSCALAITIGQYIFIAFVIKALSISALMLVFVALLYLVKKATVAIGVAAIFIAVQYLLYINIPIASTQNAFKFINVFYLIDSYEILRRYQNINLYGTPVNMLDICLFCYAIALVLSAGFLVIHFKRGKPAQESSAFLPLLADKASKLRDKLLSTSSLYLYELKKLLISSRGIVVLFALIAFIAFTYQTERRITEPVIAAYKNYMLSLSGEINDATLAALKQKSESLNRNLASDEAIYYQYDAQAFAEIEQQVQYLLANQQAYGITPILIDDTGYSALFIEQEAVKYTLLLSLGVILICSSVFSREYSGDMHKLLRTCIYGNHLIYFKASACVTAALACCIVVFLGQFLVLSNSFSFDYWQAGVQCVRSLGAVTIRVTIGEYFVIISSIRIVVSCVLALCICGLSVLCKLNTTALILCTVTLVLPLVASQIGARFLIQYNVLSLLTSPELFLYEPIIFSVILILHIAGAAFIVIKKWTLKTNFEVKAC